MQKPKILRTGPKKGKKRGRPKKYPRVRRRRPSSEVRKLLKYSPVLREQSWQRYRIKDTDKGPEVWEVKWAVCWRKGEAGLPGRRHCLIVARHRRSEIFRCQLRAGRKGNHVAMVVASGFWSLVGGAMFPRGQRRTGDGPLPSAWLALRPSSFLRDAIEPLVLCSRASGVRRSGQRAVRSNVTTSAATNKPASLIRKQESRTCTRWGSTWTESNRASPDPRDDDTQCFLAKTYNKD